MIDLARDLLSPPLFVRRQELLGSILAGKPASRPSYLAAALDHQPIEIDCSFGDRVPTEMRDHSLSPEGAEPIAQFGVASEPVDGVGQARGECGWVRRLKGSRLDMRINEKAGFVWNHDFGDAAHGRGNHRGL